MGLLHVEKEPAVSQNVGRLDHAGSLFVRREKTASARRKAIRIMLCNQHEGVSPTANVSMSAGHANRLKFLNMEPSLGSEPFWATRIEAPLRIHLPSRLARGQYTQIGLPLVGRAGLTTQPRAMH